MSVKYIEPNPDNFSTRTKRHFWAITEQWTVVEVAGYSTQQPTMWWVPSLGFTMSIGHHLFDGEQDARRRARADLTARISELQLALLNLK